MTETLLIVPLIVLILALTMYVGYVVVRKERGSMLARYETWRDVAQAPGPGSSVDTGNLELNKAFYNNKADTLTQRTDDDFFPEDPYDQLRQAAATQSGDTVSFTDAYIYRPGGDYRLSRGRRESFGMLWQNTSDMWDRISKIAPTTTGNPESDPLIRGFVRIGNEWRYTNDWHASADTWADTAGGAPGAHHLRALRDAFLSSFDSNLDSLDGSSSAEYDDHPMPQNPNTTTLAGTVRSLYLTAPGYRGPTVTRSNLEQAPQ